DGLVVLPLPYRSMPHVMDRLGLDPGRSLGDGENAWFRHLGEADALALLASALGENKFGEAQRVVRQCFNDRGDLRLGLFVVLAAGGRDVPREPAFEHHLTGRTEPLARYLALQSSDGYRAVQSRFPLNWGGKAAPEGLLHNLATFRDLTTRWQREPWFGTGAAVRPGDLA